MAARNPFKDHHHQSYSLTKKILPWALYALIPLIFIRLYLYPIPIVQSQRSQVEFQYTPLITTTTSVQQSQETQGEFEDNPIITTTTTTSQQEDSETNPIITTSPPPIVKSQTTRDDLLNDPFITTSPPPTIQSQNNPIITTAPPIVQSNPFITNSPPLIQSQRTQENLETSPIITTSPPPIQSPKPQEEFQNKTNSITTSAPQEFQNKNSSIATSAPPLIQSQKPQEEFQDKNSSITTSAPPLIQSQEPQEEFQNKTRSIITSSPPLDQSQSSQEDFQNNSSITSQSQKVQEDFKNNFTIHSSSPIVQPQSQNGSKNNPIITSSPPLVQSQKIQNYSQNNPIATTSSALDPSQRSQEKIQSIPIITISSPSTSPSPDQEKRSKSDESAPCDYFNGKWVHDMLGPLYNGTTCGTIKDGQNCITHGRPDKGYLYWRWRPKQCQLPRFNPSTFLNLHKNKHLAFIGDSMARNQLESLLCLLSSVSNPDLVYTREENKFRRWNFPSHNVNVSVYWAPFLVKGVEKSNEFNYNKLFLDSVDDRWAGEMEHFDVVVLSIGHWFLHPAIYHDKGVALGCHYCPDLNYTEIGFYDVYRKAFNTTLRAITDRRGNNAVNVIVTTFSPAHFEGDWDKAGACSKTKPYKEGEKELGWMDTEMRKIQVEEVEKAKTNAAQMTGLRFEALDVTRLADMRADGHPGPYMNPFPFADGVKDRVQNDCVHWCLPGPIDTWNEILLELVKRWEAQSSRVS